MKVAVVGGGIFGATAAVHAARAGHEVTLFEELPDLLQAASGINQYRLHRGYHYPRSAQTAQSAIKAELSFREEYSEAVIEEGRHLYAIAKEKSLVSGEDFLAFCREQELAFEIVDVPEIVNPSAVEFVLHAVEARFDPNALREAARRKLSEGGVHVRLGTRARMEVLESFERVIVAAYAGTNALCAELTGVSERHQYEVCEKPVVTLPAAFGQTDLVIMDGPFMCVDPIGKTGQYVLGNVVHAIHATNTGQAPEIPSHLAPLLNRGVISNPEHTKFDLFRESGIPFIPMLAEAKHVGSLYTVRTVLPGLDSTDARPTLVTAIGNRCIRIFSGKIGNCVQAARDAVALM